MIDRKWIGHSLPTTEFPIERSRLRFFAKVIGETNPVYLDERAAQAAGHPDLPAPPTFLFTAEMDSGLKLQWLAEAQISLAGVLHGEQSFTNHRMVYAGDTVSVTTRISDIHEKRKGALECIVMDTTVANQHGELVGESRSLIIVRNQGPKA